MSRTVLVIPRELEFSIEMQTSQTPELGSTSIIWRGVTFLLTHLCLSDSLEAYSVPALQRVTYIILLTYRLLMNLLIKILSLSATALFLLHAP